MRTSRCSSSTRTRCRPRRRRAARRTAAAGSPGRTTPVGRRWLDAKSRIVMMTTSPSGYARPIVSVNGSPPASKSGPRTTIQLMNRSALAMRSPSSTVRIRLDRPRRHARERQERGRRQRHEGQVADVGDRREGHLPSEHRLVPGPGGLTAAPRQAREAEEPPRPRGPPGLATTACERLATGREGDRHEPQVRDGLGGRPARVEREEAAPHDAHGHRCRGEAPDPRSAIVTPRHTSCRHALRFRLSASGERACQDRHRGRPMRGRLKRRDRPRR